MAYNLHLTEEDISTISFVGYRYCWSDWLDENCYAGSNTFTESEAWDMKEEFDNDTEGGHSMFPMLDPDSDLYSTLCNLYESIV